jgi:DNA-binding transcriptional MerR regulator
MTYKTGQFAKRIGVSIETLKQWDKNGTLKAFRYPTNRRYYTEEQAKQILEGGKNAE